MKIILTHAEIQEAIRSSVLSQISVREDQQISISFGAGHEFDATINIDKASDGSNGPSGGNQGNEAPKTAAPRGKRAAAAAATVKADIQEDELQAKEEAKTEGQTVPWEEPAAAETVQATETAEPAAEPVAEAAVAQPNETKPLSALTPVVKIFPDATSSAAPETPKPDVASAAKSLFANLTKPTQ